MDHKFTKVFKILSIIITVLVLFWIAMQILVKPIVETVASQVVGARVSMGTFSLNVFSQQVHITNMRIYNEEGFPSQVFFDAPEIMVNADIPQIMAGKLHFPLVVFNLRKMMVDKNAKGQLNVDQLKIVQQKLHDKNKGPMPNFKIDELRLNIDQVIVEDESQSPPVIQAYDLNLKNKTFQNLDSVSKLVGVIMFQALKPTAIQSAGLYAATTLLGVGFLPGLAIGIAIAKDDATSDMPHSAADVYQKSLYLVKQLGVIKKSDDQAMQINALVYKCDITITVHSKGWGGSTITIKARKYFLPKPEIAAGLLYQLKELF